MNQKTKTVIENGAGTVAGTACGPGTVVVIAGGATDAAALTGALATLGGGSMLTGFGVVAAIGIGGFIGCRWIVRRLMR
jgi:hypothetical protein